MKKLMEKINTHGRTIISLFKPEDIFDACFSIFTFAVLANGSLCLSSPYRVIEALLFGFFLFSGTIILNQVYDIEIDKINKPHRPMASGVLSNHSGLILSIIMYFFAFLLSLMLGMLYSFILLLGIFATVIYSHPVNRVKKGSIFLQIFIVTLGYSLMTAAIGWNVYQTIQTIPVWLILYILLTDVGAVFIKDFMDYKGDKQHGYQSLPVIFGFKKAAIYSIIVYNGSFLIFFFLSLFQIIPQKISIPSLYCMVTGFYAYSLLINDKYHENGKISYYIITSNLFAVRALLIWAII